MQIKLCIGLIPLVSLLEKRITEICMQSKFQCFPFNKLLYLIVRSKTRWRVLSEKPNL